MYEETTHKRSPHAPPLPAAAPRPGGSRPFGSELKARKRKCEKNVHKVGLGLGVT